MTEKKTYIWHSPGDDYEDVYFLEYCGVQSSRILTIVLTERKGWSETSENICHITWHDITNGGRLQREF